MAQAREELRQAGVEQAKSAFFIGSRQAASVPGFIGVAVSRTSFWKAVVAFEAKCLSLDAAGVQMVQNIEEWSRSIEVGCQTGMEVNSDQGH
jgi:hypothetical protein